jgi:hypothetical protein
MWVWRHFIKQYSQNSQILDQKCHFYVYWKKRRIFLGVHMVLCTHEILMKNFPCALQDGIYGDILVQFKVVVDVNWINCLLPLFRLWSLCDENNDGKIAFNEFLNKLVSTHLCIFQLLA